MIPFRDENPTRSLPIVVVALIAANVVVFLHQLLLSDVEHVVFVYTHGAIPAVLLGGADIVEVLPPPVRAAVLVADLPVKVLQPTWLTILTAMFLHGGLLHLGSNMLYLWIFGNNVEDVLGHVRFLVFYLVCGALAAAAQILMSLRSPVPMIGASGAIAGVLGAYYVKFPHARVQCLVFLFFFITVVMLPAGLVLLIWFLLQILNSMGSAQGGVAFFAHIGGFVAGWALIRRFEPRRRRPRYIRWSR